MMQGDPERITHLVATMMPQADVVQIDGPTWRDLIVVEDEECSGGDHLLPDQHVYRIDEDDDHLLCSGCVRERFVTYYQNVLPMLLGDPPLKAEGWERCPDCHYWRCRCGEAS